jgi:AcrR family transcriptional regulator
MKRERLSRDERRRQTRERLLDAASAVFARVGYNAASVDAVAEAAGLTKGAVYSNYASKEELFLALLDRRVASVGGWMEDVTRAAESSVSWATDYAARVSGAAADATADAMRLAEAFMQGVAPHQEQERDDTWVLLSLEFSLLAARKPEVRRRLAQRYRDAAEEIADGLRDVSPAARRAGRNELRELACAVLALDNGYALMGLVAPEMATPAAVARAMARLLGDSPGDSANP